MRLFNRRLSIHHILLLVSLLMLLLPLGSLHFLKLYESALIRQTESELIAQAAFISAIYRQEIGGLLQREKSADAYGLPLPRGRNHREYFQPVFAHLDLAKEKFYPPRPNGVMGGHGPDRLALLAGTRVTPVLFDARRTTLSGMKVLDYRGVVVAGQQEVGLSFRRLPEVRNALQGENVSLLRLRHTSGPVPPLSSISRGAGVNVVVALPILMHNRVIGVAMVNRTPMDLMKVLYTKRANIGWATVIIILLVLALSALTSLTITQPVQALIRQARRISAGNASGNEEAMQPIPHPVTREIALLSESLSEMARTIQRRSAYIRNFATSVSHEFKTPLTAIQGSVELLQEHWDTMALEQRNRFLSNIGDDTDRLRRLVNRVLELARAETLEPVQGETRILPVLNALAARYRDHGLTVILSDALVQAQPQALLPVEVLETVFVSLWDNSLQHGATRSEISHVDAENKRVIVVRDNGPGVSSANREKIFTPFFTTQRDKGGTGLGLSIARQLLETYHATIELSDETPGAVFHIILPL